MTFTALFARHHHGYSEDFDTFDQALGFLTSGFDYGTLALEGIAEDGKVILEGDELRAAVYAKSDGRNAGS